MENIIEGRAGFETLGQQYPVAANVTFENTSFANIPCTWVKPPAAAEDDLVVYIHGGAFIYGNINSHAAMVSHIALALNRNILFIDYRLAPEHPFPGGVNDCVAAITAFCNTYPNVRYGIIGDSAGGNLTMATQLELKGRNTPMPRYSVVISPWADLECKNPSFTKNRETDTILSREYLLDAAHLYAGGGKLSDSLLSPVNADMSGLPPALILYGTAEILADDSIQLHQQFLKAGVAAKLIAFENEQHVWPFMDIHTPASQKALADIAAFVQ